MKNKVVVLLAGGIDSSTALAVYLNRNPETEIHAITFQYGQAHRQEIGAACDLAEYFQVERHIVKDIENSFRRIVTKGELTGAKETSFNGKAPRVYVPGRNFIFISYAVAYAVSNEIQHILIGVHTTDFPFPDCREETIKAFAQAIYLGTPNNVILHAPLIKMIKSDIVKKGIELQVPLEKTLSCYYPEVDRTPCGKCDSCQIRAHAFKMVEAIDPALKKFN